MADGNTFTLDPDLAERVRVHAEGSGLAPESVIADALEAHLIDYGRLVWDEGGPPSKEADRAAREESDREGWISGEEFLADLRAMAERFEARIREKG